MFVTIESGRRAPLNRCCAFAPDLESMLRDKMLKIRLQQYLPQADIAPVVIPGGCREFAHAAGPRRAIV
jgi:hypothetical protein